MVKRRVRGEFEFCGRVVTVTTSPVESSEEEPVAYGLALQLEEWGLEDVHGVADTGERDLIEELEADRDEARSQRDRLADVLKRCSEFHEARVEHWREVPGQRAERNRRLAQTWVDNIREALGCEDGG